MSRVTANWVRLRSVYQRTIGTPLVPVKPKLTIGGVSNKEIVCGTPGSDFVTDWAALGNLNTFEVQALGSDFPTDPVKGATATITGLPADIGTVTRKFLSTTRRDGIVYFTLGENCTPVSTSNTRVTSNGDTRVTSGGDTRVTS